MAPVRPTTRMRVQQPIKRHPRRILNNTELFWIHYATTINENGILDAHQTERFWLELIQRAPPRRRASSLPPTPKAFSIIPKAPIQPGEPQSIFTKFKRVVSGAVAKVNNGAGGLRNSIRGLFNNALHRLPNSAIRGFASISRRRKLILATILLSGAVYANYTAAVARSSVSSIALTKYHQFPTWIYTDPAQVLGFPASVSPTLPPNWNHIQLQYKKFQFTWHPDHWKPHGFASPHEAKIANARGIDAYNIFEKFYDNPNCYGDIEAFRLRQALNFTYNDSLPSFQHPCRCTYPAFILQGVKKAVIPVFLQYSRVPQTEVDLASYCPCTQADARASWASFARDVQPPWFYRIVMNLSWKTLDWRVYAYKLRGPDERIPFELEDTPSTRACLEGTLPGCENMPGWGVDGDIVNEHSYCLTPTRKYEEKEKKAREADKQWHLDNNVTWVEPVDERPLPSHEEVMAYYRSKYNYTKEEEVQDEDPTVTDEYKAILRSCFNLTEDGQFQDEFADTNEEEEPTY